MERLKKLNQYHTFKFDSDRLRELDFRIVLTEKDALESAELVSIGDSQLLRTVRRITGNESKFVPEIVSVVIRRESHYRRMIKSGLYVNGRRFVRLLCGAGNARVNTVFFVDERIEKELKYAMKNNYDENLEIVPNKYNAYFALASSATLPVSNPRFVVIDDCVTHREELVDFINPDNTVSEEVHELEFNLFDGMGIVSPKFAKQWADDLELDYLPSAFCIRYSWVKGMVCVIDFHKFAHIHNKDVIVDVWGKEHPVDDVDLIITTSQFKLWKGYRDMDTYVKHCLDNGWEWGISKVTPKRDKSSMMLNYQFVQVLNINKEQVKELCEPTINWIKGVLGNIDKHALLYMGRSMLDEMQESLLDVRSNEVKAIAIDPSIVNDKHIREYLYNSLKKRIKESYIGKLVVDGNFQVMISDPYAFMEHAFKMPVKGLLRRSEHYARYWTNKGVERVVGMRAPLTWRSEVNVLNCVTNKEIDEWYEYLYSGIVYNIHGNDCMIHADSDETMSLHTAMYVE